MHIEFFLQVLGQVFGTIDRTVLATGAAERHLQMVETAFQKTRYMMIHQGINGMQERQYFAVLLQKVNDRLVQARQLFELVVFARVVRAAAVEDISAAVAAGVLRDAALKGERVNR